jgi:2-polyprenyl-6-methoxyphenol hydroxylase-like FAD-dependent oxidoreductase
MQDITTEKQEKQGRAIVIGASIAGLLAARVLADHYEQILIVERDILPEHPQARAGAPQTYHLHRLLPRGDMILARLFPGFVDDLLAHGAFPLEGKRSALLIDEKPIIITPPPSSQKQVSCSRPLLEWEIRQRVQALPGVQFLTDQEVIGLCTKDDKTHVTGISVRQRGQIEEQRTLQADLVIDASGRTSKLTRWLEALGYELPENEQVHASIGYSTRHYQLPTEATDEWGLIGKRTSLGFGMAISHVENRTYTVIIGTIGGAYPPTDAVGFEHELANNFGALLPDILQNAQPLGDPRGFRVPVCVRHHYEQMGDWPTGLLVIGDALCSFDPIYGQGMSVAAIEAETLARSLHEQQHDPRPAFEQHVLKQMQKAIAPAWWLSSIADLSAPGVTYTGPSPLKGAGLIQAYLNLYFKYAMQSMQNPQPQGSFSQTLATKYFMMQGLVLSPREVINAPTLATLLTFSPPSMEQQLLSEFCQLYPNHFEEMLSEIVPDFGPLLPAQDQALLQAQMTLLSSAHPSEVESR